MSMISEQVKEIRRMTNVLHEEKRYAAEEIMRQAADTIESLSAKLQAANMERSAECEKSILKIETPKVCIDCPCHFAGESGMVMCRVEKRELLSDDIESYKPDWCPLRESADCGGWISCKERLPEEYGDYLVAWKPLYMTKDQMIELVGRVVPHFYEIVEYDPDDDKKWIGDIKQAHGQYEIIAWQPLPKPYHEP